MQQNKILYYTGSESLAYSDVYLTPNYSDIKSRFGPQIDTGTLIALGAPKLNIPFISSGMDTVTEDGMATVLALNGGIGEIHRNNIPEEQAELVRKVKEQMRIMEIDPPMVSEKATIQHALDILQHRQRGYVLVYPGHYFKGEISGIATSRDFLSGNLDTPISEVMTPVNSGGAKKMITVPEGTQFQKAVEIMKMNRIEKVPVLSKHNKLVGVYTMKDYFQIMDHPNSAVDSQGRLLVGAAIGVHDIDIDRAHMLVDAGADVLFLDIAHGHSSYSAYIVKRLKIKENIKTPIIVGNVATKKGVLFAYDIGADGIKVGIGPGFVCKTRNIAGTGVPQITAILEAKAALINKRKMPPIIADGGIREPGDVPKAIACGADSVMIGSILAGTDKSPGDILKINGILQKRIRGMASKGVFESRSKMKDSTTNPLLYAPEGRETFTPYQGSTQDILYEYIGGLRSAMSYTGSHSIRELQQSQLIHVGQSGANEQNRAISG